MSDQAVRLFAHTDIDMESARAIFHEFNKSAEISSLRRIPEGGSTSNYIVLMEDGRRYLLKLYPEGGGNGALEAAAYRYAGQYAKVPEIYLFDDSLAVFNRPYAVIEFIEGVGLNRYVMQNGGLPESIARTIGERLALLHGREYGRMALLDATLNVRQELLPISALHANYLNGEPGGHIGPEAKDDVLGFLDAHPELLAGLAERIVFCHGDFSPGNVIVDVNGEIWFIDFEYGLAAPPYYDIGKFFRDRPGANDRQSVRDSFVKGYNSCAARPLREDWYKLSRLMDMTSLLHLLNYESAACWAKDIEKEIRHTMMILRGSCDGWPGM